MTTLDHTTTALAGSARPALVQTCKEEPFLQTCTTPLGALGVETLQRLRTLFDAKFHHPSPTMWAALADIVKTLEDMAKGTAEAAVHLASLDPGVGKTQSVAQFLPVLLASRDHSDVSVLVCAGRLEQIKDLIRDAQAAGLSDQEFAVFTSDDGLNGLGRGQHDRSNARVLFTTHAMVMKRCAGGAFAAVSEFHYRHTPREVRVWDEAITPGLEVTLSHHDLASLIKPVSQLSPKLAERLSNLFAQLLGCRDGDQFTLPDLASECRVDLNDLEGILDTATADQKTAANTLWFLYGKTVTVRLDGRYGNAMLDYRETFPPDLAPLLVLDASSRRAVRATYPLWEAGRGGIKRLLEAPKDYSPLTIGVWQTGGGKGSFKKNGQRLVQGVANEINLRAAEKWLVIHHKDPAFEETVRALLSADAQDVQFRHYGAHEGTNEYADYPNVILAGTLFLRPSHYEALGRAAAGLPSSAGPFPREVFEQVRRGEHRHLILQAVCRGRVRKCDGARCPPSRVYIIASRASRIADDLASIFPGACIEAWEPVQRTLTGKIGAAAAYIIDRAKGGALVPFTDVMRHLGITDKSNFNRTIRKHEDFVEALAEHGIAAWPTERSTGYRRLYDAYFSDPELEAA